MAVNLSFSIQKTIIKLGSSICFEDGNHQMNGY